MFLFSCSTLRGSSDNDVSFFFFFFFNLLIYCVFVEERVSPPFVSLLPQNSRRRNRNWRTPGGKMCISTNWNVFNIIPPDSSCYLVFAPLNHKKKKKNEMLLLLLFLTPVRFQTQDRVRPHEDAPNLIIRSCFSNERCRKPNLSKATRTQSCVSTARTRV